MVWVLTRIVVRKHVLVIDGVERLTRKWTWAHVPGHAVRMRLQGFLIRSRSLRWVRRDSRPAHKDRMGQVNQCCGSFLGVGLVNRMKLGGPLNLTSMRS